MLPYYDYYYYYYYCILIRSDSPSGLFFRARLLLFILAHLVLPSSYVSLSYFILAVHMRKTLMHELPISYSHTEWYRK